MDDKQRIIDAVEKELRGIRGQRKIFKVYDLTKYPTLMSLFPTEDTWDVYGRIRSIGDSWGVGDKFVDAAVISLFHRADTVLRRLEAVSSKYYIDQRNARTWTDVGLKKLAAYLVDTSRFNVEHSVTHDVGLFYFSDKNRLACGITSTAFHEYDWQESIVEAYSVEDGEVVVEKWPIRDVAYTRHKQDGYNIHRRYMKFWLNPIEQIRAEKRRYQIYLPSAVIPHVTLFNYFPEGHGIHAGLRVHRQIVAMFFYENTTSEPNDGIYAHFEPGRDEEVIEVTQTDL